jgi:tetratricopeptide (TPR) repeat protein
MRMSRFFSRFGLPALALLLVCGVRAWTQDDVRPPATPERIAAELKRIESAASWHATTDQLGRVWALLAADYQDLGDLRRAEDGYDHALKLLRGSASAERSYAITLDALGSLYLETGRNVEAENCRRKALAIFEKLGDQRNASALHSHLALTLLREDKYKEAEKEASETLEGMQGQKDVEPGRVVSVLFTRVYARCHEHRCKEGLADARQAMEIVRTELRPDTLEAVAAWVALGYALWKTGDNAGGGESMREGLRILSEKKDMPQPVFAYARLGLLTQYAQFLNATHRKEEARQVESEMALLSDGQVRSCNGCTVNVVALSNTLR